ncbi:MAG: hypothetical protein H6740_17480 [Alphaproteobacteria bacterium]|nr:hypothetical protein [Alphaproteobacteria bacterium]
MSSLSPLALLSLLACQTPPAEPAECPSCPEVKAQPVAVGVPARAGSVDGTSQNSDEFMWRALVDFTKPLKPDAASPVLFETWASDADTFSLKPAWPAPDAPKRFKTSTLLRQKAQHPVIDVPCNPPGSAASGGFPTIGDPAPCIAEEVKRNRSQFDYIVNNKLNDQAGLAAAFTAQLDVQMPTDALSVKGDWIPVQTLLEWIPALEGVDTIRELYYTNTSDGVEYAVVSLHVSSRQNANWVWGTFEHEMNPGRCDYMGCYDTFGAKVPEVAPNLQERNAGYGKCEKSDTLSALMQEAGLSEVWSHYCMKSTQVDYNAPDGTPYILGNSVIEGIVGNGTVAASSCIACHVYASFGADGAPTAAATAMLPFNPTGEPYAQALEGSLKFDFMWGVLNAPAPKKKK